MNLRRVFEVESTRLSLVLGIEHHEFARRGLFLASTIAELVMGLCSHKARLPGALCSSLHSNLLALSAGEHLATPLLLVFVS